MSRGYSEIITALYRPLHFAARNDGRNFQNIQNFNDLVKDLLQEAKDLQLPAEESRLVESLWCDFEGFETFPLRERSSRVKRAFARLAKAREKSPQNVPAPGTDQVPGMLQASVISVKGIGKALVQKLARKNIETVEDALFDLPLRYEDRSALCPIAQVEPGKWRTVRGRVIRAQVGKNYRGRKVLTVVLGDESGTMTAKWFNYRGKVPDKRFEVGNSLIFSGPVHKYHGRTEIRHPEVEVQDKVEAGKSVLTEERIVPIYSLTEGLSQKYYRMTQRRIALTYARYIQDVLPKKLLQKYCFISLPESVLRIHCPDKDTDLDLLNRHRSPAQKRVIFEELFFLALSIEMRRQNLAQLPAVPMLPNKENNLSEKFMDYLSFQLTGAQQRVLRQIFHDLEQPHAMNRLLQGDVGSGKTVVAMLTALRVIENNYQVAFMVPTEILSEQHFANIETLFQKLDISCAHLTGSTTKKNREEILNKISSGETQVLLGTHALLEEEILFSKLGLVIVDEQHRFGVMQRVALRKKGLNPHCLVMTATPIPRTLAMTVYGDLDLSIIDELPPGRIPILTKIIPQSQSARLYKTIENEIRCGHQAYIVYPLIEESETLDLKNAMEMFEKLQTVFPHFRLALIHGRMKTQEKDEVMASFKSGKTQILVSTTVIEVGIDVANATLMVIENAERFGLSQLHQLRGRVGRGKAASQCILVPGTKKTQDAKMRLNIMVQTNDGFRIAEEDLRIRGPGEVLGTRQAGLPIFCYAELRRDAEIFDQASQSAKQIFLEDPKLENPENQLLQQVMLEKWQGRLQLSRIG